MKIINVKLLLSVGVRNNYNAYYEGLTNLYFKGEFCMTKWWRVLFALACFWLYPVLGIIVIVIFAKKGYFKDLF